VRSEIEDRMGPFRRPWTTFFQYARLRREASRLGVVSIDREADRLAVKFSERAGIDPDKLIAMVSEGGASFAPSGVLKLRLTSGEDAEVFAEVRGMLTQLR